MMWSSRHLAAFLAIASCLVGNVSYQLHALHLATAHTHADEFEPTELSRARDHDEAEHDPSDHSHELVSPPDAVATPGVTAPLLVPVVASACESMWVLSDLFRLGPPLPHPRAGPPSSLHRSQLNL